MKRLEQLQAQESPPAQSEFLIDVGSISWIIPKEVKWAVIRSRSVVVTYGIGLLVLWLSVDLTYHLSPEGNSRPEWVATRCTVGVVPLLLFVLFLILSQTSIVTLNHKGIRMELLGKPKRIGDGRPPSVPYGSITDCRIEPSRLVPRLPCLTFKFPGKLGGEKTARVEMPGSADVGAVLEFLSKKGVACSDRR
jgi:hypothetical protein